MERNLSKVFDENADVHFECHAELIKCPECDLVQPAVVEHTIPFASYVHECKKCKYVITESEWNTVEVEKLLDAKTESEELKKVKYLLNRKIRALRVEVHESIADDIQSTIDTLFSLI